MNNRFKPTKYIDPWNYYENEDELKKNIEFMKEQFKLQKELCESTKAITKEFLEEYIKLEEVLFVNFANFHFFILAVQWSNFKDPLPEKYQPILSELTMEGENIKNSFNSLLSDISVKDYESIVDSSDLLSSAKHKVMSFKLLAPMKLEGEKLDRLKELQKKEQELEIEFNKIDNLPPKDTMKFRNKEININDIDELLSDPTKSTNEERRELYIFKLKNKKDKEDELSKITFEIIKTKVEIEKLYGTEDFISKIEKMRSEKPGFINKLINHSNEIYLEMKDEWEEIKNSRIMKFNNLDKVEKYNELLPYYENVDLPYDIVLDFYENDASKYIGDNSKIIVNNYEKEGRLAIIKHDDKVNWGAAAPFSPLTGAFTMLFNYDETDKSSPYIMAHEMGHSMHGYYVEKNLRPINRYWAPIIGEGVADTFGNLLGMCQVEKKTKESKKIIASIIQRFFSVVEWHAQETKMTIALIQGMWSGEIKTIEDAIKNRYDVSVMLNGGEPKMFEDINISEINSKKIYANKIDLMKVNYVASSLIGINLASHVIEGNIDPLINVMKQGDSSDSITILKNAGIKIEEKEFYNDAAKVIIKLMNYIKED